MDADRRQILRQDLIVASLVPPSAHEIFAAFEPGVRELFSSMDDAYADVAGSLGFRCNGCEDSCCGERFHHYTLSEYFFLGEGYRFLSGEVRRKVFSRAREVARIYEAEDLAGGVGDLRVMCPLNHGGLCLVYGHRPMICRLHGIPHVLRMEGRQEKSGAGCHVIQGRFPSGSDLPAVLDRSGFYRRMAEIEIDLRKAAGFAGHFRRTVADMIVSLEGEVVCS